MNSFAGIPLLTRAALRRDRIIIVVWIAVLELMVFASAAATATLYRTAAEQVAAAEGLNASGAIVALYGPILDVHSLGELAMTKMTVLYAVFVAALLVVLVRRHTCVEEESGRLEMLGGTAVGRDAPLTSAVVEATGVSLIVGLFAAIAAMAGGLPSVGSLAFGATWVGTGLVATGITALTSQMSASSRTCGVITAAVLAALYVLRAVGDVSAHWLSWLSPFGWNTQLRAWSGTRWWVLLLYVALFAVLLIAARALHNRRDLGSGVFAARPGAAAGSPRLASPLALCVRVNSMLLLVWTLGVGALGAIFGAIAPRFGGLLDNPTMREMLERLGGVGALADSMVAAVLSMLAIAITYFAVTVIAHTGADESSGRAEVVLATATSRSRWLWASVAVAFVGALWLLLVAGVCLWAGYRTAGAPSGGHPNLVVPAALTWAPAVWLTSALAVALLALRRAALGYALPAACLVITLLGEAFKAPDWVTGLSPYSHIPQMPTQPFTMTPVAILTALAVAVLLAAWRWFERRDIG